jgi:hypothetical protein
VGGRVVVMKEHCGYCSDFLANSITDPNGVCELMDCSATVFVDEFSNFSTFSVALLVLGRP